MMLQDAASGVYQKTVVLKIQGVRWYLGTRYPCPTLRNTVYWVWAWAEESILIDTPKGDYNAVASLP